MWNRATRDYSFVLFVFVCLVGWLVSWLVGSKQGICKQIQETREQLKPWFKGRCFGIPGVQDLVFPSEVILVNKHQF